MRRGEFQGTIRHIISAQQFQDLALLENIFSLADMLRDGATGKELASKLLATIFYEPSTRTRLSFETAMYRLGGQVISSENARVSSSAMKGETLEDTIRTIGVYADAIVLRHSETGAAARAAAVSPVPVINAGDGAGEHPTQALLDLYTLQRHLGPLSGRTIALVGDLLYGRTVHSLVQLLAVYQDVQIVLTSPPELRLPEVYRSPGLHWHDIARLSELTQPVDALYVTRIQKERLSDPRMYPRLQRDYVIDQAALRVLRPGGIIMHPLPRAGEIAADVDADPRAVYFEQIENGVFVRMALLAWLLSDTAEFNF